MRSLFVTAVFLLSFVALPAQAAPSAELWSFWDKSDESNKNSIDHRAWTKFLKTYIVEDESRINKVAYAKVSAADRTALQDYVYSLASRDPRGFNKSEQLAYWVNLYNALTVEVVLQNPDKKSILKMGAGFFSIGPWDDEQLKIAGQAITLNDIEHRILRPIWQDHRIHYAVNCASIGCPNLVATAYTAENAERLLSEGESAYINHERGVTFNGSKLQVSQIFEWYGGDFANDDKAFLKYLSMHHKTLAEKLSGYKGRIKYEYNWDLNKTS